MSRELLLLRHGKSDWSLNLADFQRPLKKRGKIAAQRIGVWLQQNALVPDFILSSTAERAINTASKCCKTMGIPAKQIHKTDDAYLAEETQLLKLLADIPENHQRVMLVGHNPGMEDLLCFLLGKMPPLHKDGKILPTGTLAHLVLPDNWGALLEGDAKLKKIIRGKELPEGFPYPDHKSKIFRDRPSYYYSQSAAIPYRLIEGNLEVMLIGSSGNKHRGIPKGIVDPGLTPAESALKEAWEEAGIKGEISGKSLGSYTYEKWGGECNVEVYAMQVSEQVPDDIWRENYRGREWMPVGKAGTYVKQTKLVPFFNRLEKLL